MLPLQNITIGDAIAIAAEKYGSRMAMEYGGNTWSYEELDEFSDSLACGLLAMGVGRGSHIGILGDLEPNILLAFYALQKIGAVAVMFYSSVREDEFINHMKFTECGGLLVGSHIRDVGTRRLCRELAEDERNLVYFIGSQGSKPERSIWRIVEKGRMVSRDVLQTAKKAVMPEDPSTILFTSGTSGHPKAVVSSHYSRMNSGYLQAEDLGATCEDHFCVILPMFHCFCISTNILASLASGGCIHLLESRHTQDVLRALSRWKCTVFNAVPTVFHAIISREDLHEYDLSSLRVGFIGGGSYTPAQFEDFEKTLGMTLLSSLGQTEATAGITTTYRDDPLEVRSTTVGHFMAHVEGKIADMETGDPLPAGKVGEICVRGYVVMKEYYHNPELTAKTIDADGWLHTGDTGWLDGDGNVHLYGRLKDLVIRAGENISPMEVAAALTADHRIAEVKVLGVPDSHYGEELCACVVLQEGASMTEEEVRDVARERLMDFKVPRYVHFFDALPYSATGKVVEAKLRAMLDERGLVTA